MKNCRLNSINANGSFYYDYGDEDIFNYFADNVSGFYKRLMERGIRKRTAERLCKALLRYHLKAFYADGYVDFGENEEDEEEYETDGREKLEKFETTALPFAVFY